MNYRRRAWDVVCSKTFAIMVFTNFSSIGSREYMSFGRRWLRARAAGIDTDRAAPVGSPVDQASN
jgi:hypothetical protein